MSRVFLLGSQRGIGCPDCSDCRRKWNAFDFLLNVILIDPDLQLICSVYPVVRYTVFSFIVYSGTYLQRNRKGPNFFIFAAGWFRLHWYLKFGLYELYDFPAKDRFPVRLASV
jgi:hypothetical protein